MSWRKYREFEDNMPLPWQIEAALWFFGLLAMPIAMTWFAWEITGPGQDLAELLGTSFDPQPLVQRFWPFILLFGAIWGVKVRCWCRRWVIRKLCQSL